MLLAAWLITPEDVPGAGLNTEPPSVETSTWKLALQSGPAPIEHSAPVKVTVAVPPLHTSGVTVAVPPENPKNCADAPVGNSMDAISIRPHTTVV